MKIDRIQFAKLKAQWDILKMKSAYIEAERAIVQDPSLTQWQEQAHLQNKEMSPEEFWQSFTNEDIKPIYSSSTMSLKDIQRANIEAQMYEIEETGRKLLKEEKYELMQEAKEIWEKLNQQLKNLK